MRGKLSAVLVATALAAVAAACGGQAPPSANTPETVNNTTTPATSAAPNRQAVPSTTVNQPTITVTGSCNDSGGMRLDAHGFTPNGAYQTVASYPDNTPYNYLANGGRGRANAAGELPTWSWNCKDGPNGQADRVGRYNLKVIDLTTGAAAETTFEIRY